MVATSIGIASGFFAIFLIILLRFDKRITYSLVLTGIGFLYVGFVWTDPQQLVISCIQAFLFLVIAHFGLNKNIHILAAGFFLHGLWDVAYHVFSDPGLVPPHYDLFSLAIDFVMGGYILIYKKQFLEGKFTT